MFKLDGLCSVLDKIAPLELSYKLIEKGDYDNSGVIVNSGVEVKRVLFCLDLSLSSVRRAKYLKADTIVTHHPAIYRPIKNLSIEDSSTAPLIKAIRYGMNVISMHLNLDVAEGGIDAFLTETLGGKSFKILEPLDEKYGYGREFDIKSTTLSLFCEQLKQKFQSKKIIFYGKQKGEVKKVASFCGAGASHAISALESGTLSADTVVTSDVAHHEIKAFLDKNVNLVVLPHYVAEEKGFMEFYKKTKKQIENFAECFYFDDKRFR